MNCIKRFLVVLLALFCARLSAAELFESSERYPSFSISLSLEGGGKDTIQMSAILPAHQNPNLTIPGTFSVFYLNRNQVHQPLDKKQSQILSRLTAAAMAGYKLAPVALVPGLRPEKLMIRIAGAGFTGGSFCFLRADSAQWAKAVSVWNAFRALAPPAVAADVPAL